MLADQVLPVPAPAIEPPTADPLAAPFRWMLVWPAGPNFGDPSAILPAFLHGDFAMVRAMRLRQKNDAVNDADVRSGIGLVCACFVVVDL